ncbi:MAG: (Fe-S)-binding protein [Bacteroidales bacterium]|nr:(Fe-S)-binding protein [Bacteroidales bacterium]
MSEKTENIVNIFIPCQMDMFQPDSAYSMRSVLEKIGLHCQYFNELTCCGRRFLMEGNKDYAIQLGGQVVDILRSKTHIVVPDCGCAGFMKKHYKKLLAARNSSYELQDFCRNIFEICDYIVNIRKIECLGNVFNHRVYYFKSCSAKTLYPQNDAPETLLANTKGLVLLTSPDQPACCGANGRFAMDNPTVAEGLTGQIVEEAYQMGAEYITSTDIHCLQMIDAYKTAHNVEIEVMHIVDILNGEQPETF